MENKIGEYGRTNLGKIIKFAWLQNNETGETYRNKVILVDKMMTETYPYYYFKNGEYIVKHSPNIKDILEKGDLIFTDYGLVWYDYKEVDTIVVYNGEAYIEVDEREIHKIYTKEMMESISYKV